MSKPVADGTCRWPSVSIIIPTRNRAPYIKTLLAALTTQVYRADRMEVVVVDNSSTDDTEAVVRDAAERAPFPVRYHRKEDRGPAVSRNVGASIASGEILAFTDSDCVPTPGWIRGGMLAFAPSVAVVCGPVLPVGPGPDEPFLMHQIYPIDHDTGLYPTANVFYRRTAFEQSGGFNEQWGSFSWGQPVGGDDTDLAWRVKRLGYRSAFAADALVLHQATPVSLKAYLLSTLAARVLPQLVLSVPELRHMTFWRRYFLHRGTAAFYPFLAGLVLARKRRRLGLLLTIPWLSSVWPGVRVDAWPPRRWWRFALRLVLLVESSGLLAASLAYSSARHRRLVL